MRIIDLVGTTKTLEEINELFPDLIESNIELLRKGESYEVVVTNNIDDTIPLKVEVTNQLIVTVDDTTPVKTEITNEVDVKINDTIPVDVYAVERINRGQLDVSQLFTGPITNQVIIPSPGVGKRIALLKTTVSNQMDNPNGNTHFSVNSGKQYGNFNFFKQTSYPSPNFEGHPLLIEENSPFMLTIVGTDQIYCYVQYMIVNMVE